jgi:hypothetical protein
VAADERMAEVRINGSRLVICEPGGLDTGISWITEVIHEVPRDVDYWFPKSRAIADARPAAPAGPGSE